LSYLSHCLPIHHPPPFTAQYESCCSSLFSFVHLLATPSLFKTNISLSPWSSSTFPCLVVGTQTQTQTGTHIIEHNSVYPELFFSKYYLLCEVICLNSCIGYTVNKIENFNVSTYAFWHNL